MIEAIVYYLAPVKQRRAVAFPGLIYAVILGVVLGLLLSIGRHLHGQEVDSETAAAQRAALVHIGDIGSGVCVSSKGLILTAAHCVADLVYDPAPAFSKPGPPRIVRKSSIRVRFQNQEWRVAEILAVWWKDKGSDIALLSVNAPGGLPYLPVAKTSPKVGEAVSSIGFPGGNFARLDSYVLEVTEKEVDGVPTRLIKTSHRSAPGHSGGPLFNSNGEVCGITSMGSIDFLDRDGKVRQSEQHSYFAKCEEFEGMINEVNQPVSQFTSPNTVKAKPIIDLWWAKWCEPCHLALADAQNLKINYQGKPIDQFLEIVPHDLDVERREAKRLKIDTVPTFIIRATGERIVGYKTPGPINAKIAQILNSQVVSNPPRIELDEQPETPPPEVAAPRPRSPPPEEEATAEDAEPEKVDATGVRVLLLVKKQELGILKGSALSVVEKYAETGIKKKINTALSNKAEVDLVFERTKPKRFAELLEATGLELKRNAAVVILIPKQFTGVAAKVAKAVEEKFKGLADGDWKYSTILTLAERLDPDGYQSAMEASELSEAEASSEDQSWIGYLVTSLLSALAGIRDAVLGHKVKKAAA